MLNICTKKSRADTCNGNNVVLDPLIMDVMAQEKNAENIDAHCYS